MKLVIAAKTYSVRPPIMEDGKFTITRVAYNAALPATSSPQPLRRLVKESGARKLKFPDLPSLVFYLHRNQLNGHTVTESRTGLALHKAVDNKSVELCISEAIAKLEMGFARNKGPKGFEKHVASLPSKHEYCSLPNPTKSNVKNSRDSVRGRRDVRRGTQKLGSVQR